MFAVTLVYNTQRSGEFQLGGRRYLLRRVYFPENPTPEWFVVDLLQHHEMAGVALSELRMGLVSSLKLGHWDRQRLHEMAQDYGSKATLALVEDALAELPEFVEHGMRYAFAVTPGESARGMATSWNAPRLEEHLVPVDAPLSLFTMP